MAKDISLRTTFNQQAELYHKIRPRYPEALFDTMIEVTQLHDSAKLLEIAPGTGQATESMARHGYDILAVELGAELADLARKNLAEYGNVQIVNDSFEAIDLPDNQFDLIYVATAFHWIDPVYKFKKPHDLLVENGHLAIIETVHVSDEQGDEYPNASQPIYKKYKPGGKYSDDFRLPRISELEALKIDKNLFEHVYFGTFPLAVRYTAAEYAELLNTYSPTLAMEPDARTSFLSEIEKCIADQFGGTYVKHYARTLTIARRQAT